MANEETLIENWKSFISSYDYANDTEDVLYNQLHRVCKHKAEGKHFDVPGDSINTLIQIFYNHRLGIKCGEAMLEAIAEDLDEYHIQTLLIWLYSSEEQPMAPSLIHFFNVVVELKIVQVEHFWSEVLPLTQSLNSTTNRKLVVPLCGLLNKIYNPSLVNKFIIHITKLAYKTHKIKSIADLLRKYGENISKERSMVSKANRKPAFIIKIAKNKGMDLDEEETGKVSDRVKLPEPVFIDQSEGTMRLMDISRMEDLGKKVGRLCVPRPLSSVLRSSVGSAWVSVTPYSRLPSALGPLPFNSPALAALLSRAQAPFTLSLTTPPFRSLLKTWDGLYCRSTLLQLLPWIYFDTVTELWRDHLIHIWRVYILCDTQLRVQILCSLAQLVTNMAIVHTERAKLKIPTPLCNGSPAWIRKPFVAIVQVIGIVRQFIEVGLTAENFSVLYINACLDFYKTMSELEVNAELPLWTMIDLNLTYACLFSRNVIVLDRVCSLLLRYKNVNLPYIMECGEGERFLGDVDSLNVCCSKIISQLWMNQEGGGEGLSVQTHEALIPFKYLLRKANTSSVLSYKDWISHLKTFAQGLANFIEVWEEYK